MGVDELVAIQAIKDALFRYCRSLDRMDTALYGTVFEPGASLDYGEYFAGTAEEFQTWVWETHAAFQAHSHQITNVLIEVDPEGGRAVSEAYVTVCLRSMPDAAGKAVDIVDRGRYLDRWTKAGDGSWVVASRRYRSDIQQVVDASGAPPATAVRDATDLSYELFK